MVGGLVVGFVLWEAVPLVCVWLVAYAGTLLGVLVGGLVTWGWVKVEVRREWAEWGVRGVI